MSRREFDPLGRAALFLPPQAKKTGRPRGDGRDALFSAPQRSKGTVVVDCSSCQARTPVPLAALGVRLLPSVWVPGRAHSRLMRCPSCERHTWCRVNWRSALP